jgi:hypothetical protein
MTADLNKPVFELIGLQHLYKLFFEIRVAAGQIYGISLAEHTQCILRWKVFLGFGILLDQELEDPRPLRHIFQSQVSFKKDLAAALRQ